MPLNINEAPKREEDKDLRAGKKSLKEMLNAVLLHRRSIIRGDEDEAEEEAKEPFVTLDRQRRDESPLDIPDAPPLPPGSPRQEDINRGRLVGEALLAQIRAAGKRRQATEEVVISTPLDSPVMPVPQEVPVIQNDFSDIPDAPPPPPGSPRGEDINRDRLGGEALLAQIREAGKLRQVRSEEERRQGGVPSGIRTPAVQAKRLSNNLGNGLMAELEKRIQKVSQRGLPGASDSRVSEKEKEWEDVSTSPNNVANSSRVPLAAPRGAFVVRSRASVSTTGVQFHGETELESRLKRRRARLESEGSTTSSSGIIEAQGGVPTTIPKVAPLSDEAPSKSKEMLVRKLKSDDTSSVASRDLALPTAADQQAAALAVLQALAEKERRGQELQQREQGGAAALVVQKQEAEAREQRRLQEEEQRLERTRVMERQEVSYERYFEENPDVKNACQETDALRREWFALRHYNEQGRREGRTYPKLEVYFCYERYLEENADVRAACGATDPLGQRQFALRHYNEHGRREGRPYPGRYFSDERYFEENPDVRHACSATTPLERREFTLWHYIRHGKKEGRAYPTPRASRVAP